MFRAHAATSAGGTVSRRGRRARAGVALTTLVATAGALVVGVQGAGAAGRAHAAGGTLTLQFNAPVSLNPALEGTAESDIVFGALDYDSLIFQLPNGKFVPDLATKWSYAGSKNEIFDLTLRTGVHFSDGSIMTPKSVVASIEYFKGAHGPQSNYLADLTSARATGPHTVQLRFSAPEPDLPFLFSQYQDAGQIIGPRGIAHPSMLTTGSDGTGPYVLSSSKSVANSVYVFTKAPHYWDPSAVHYSKVLVKVIADPQSALSSAESGQVDALTSVPSLVAKAAKSAGLKVYEAPFSIASLIMMDRGGSISPLGKLAVRQAINDAIDRKALAAGLGGAGSVPTDEVALPGTTGYDASLAHYYRFDISKAKALLASAGYPKGFTLSVLDTEALDPNGDLAAALKSELGAIGITVDVTETPSPAQFIPAALSKKYPAVIWPIAANGEGFPYSVEFALTPFTNAFNTTSKTLSTLMAAAGAASAPSAVSSLYSRVNDFLVRNAWYAPVFSLEATYVIGKSVTNVSAPTVLNATMDPVVPVAGLSWQPAR